MKNVQIIDGAENCSYDVFAFTDEEFQMMFPGPGQDIEFIEDVIRRVGDHKLGKIMSPIWSRKVEKDKVCGIHGTLFYELERKKKFYPGKISSKMIAVLD